MLNMSSLLPLPREYVYFRILTVLYWTYIYWILRIWNFTLFLVFMNFDLFFCLKLIIVLQHLYVYCAFFLRFILNLTLFLFNSHYKNHIPQISHVRMWENSRPGIRACRALAGNPRNGRPGWPGVVSRRSVDKGGGGHWLIYFSGRWPTWAVFVFMLCFIVFFRQFYYFTLFNRWFHITSLSTFLFNKHVKSID